MHDTLVLLTTAALKVIEVDKWMNKWMFLSLFYYHGGLVCVLWYYLTWQADYEQIIGVRLRTDTCHLLTSHSGHHDNTIRIIKIQFVLHSPSPGNINICCHLYCLLCTFSLYLLCFFFLLIWLGDECLKCTCFLNLLAFCLLACVFRTRSVSSSLGRCIVS